MGNGNNPLVSIIVITYNSSKYVLETLESAKEQTYDNIELIISDDGSTDNTVEICKKWINENSQRFKRVELITSEKNTGIPANCNRGVNAAQGEWVKLIAGDDALLPNAIHDLMNIVENKKEIELLFSKVEVYYNNFDKKNFIDIRPNEFKDRQIYFIRETTPEIQLEFLLRGGFYFTPGLIIKRKVFFEIGYFDENYKLNEDIPFYLKVGLKKKLLYFEPIVTVKYRKHKENLTSKKNAILQLYTIQTHEAILRASKEYGKIKFITNSLWNLLYIKIIFYLGNKGLICLILDKIRMQFQPIRIFNLINRIIFYFNSIK